MININQKLFHGINLGNYDEYIGNLTDLEVLDSILKLGSILSRKDLKRLKICNPINQNYYQKIDEVCLAYHPNNSKFNVTPDFLFREDAFYDFVMYHISIILDEKILNDNSYTIEGIPRELRVLHSISLPEYMVAIGYNDKITTIVTTINNLIDEKNYAKLKKLVYNSYYHEFLITKNIEQYIEYEFECYNRIKALLISNGYTIPIVDPFTGNEHDSIENSIIKSETVIKKMKQII